MSLMSLETLKLIKWLNGLKKGHLLLANRNIKDDPQYITLDKLHRMYKAHRFFAAKFYKLPSYYYAIKGPDGNIYESFCQTFGEWVDLHTRAGIYRVY